MAEAPSFVDATALVFETVALVGQAAAGSFALSDRSPYFAVADH